MSKNRTKLKAAVTALAVAATFAMRPAAAEGVQLYALQVLPAGPTSFPADGRPPLIHDNAALAAGFNAKGRRALLDVGHLSEFMETAAAGWVVELFVEADGGLWAWVELTKDGQRLIDEHLFGFTSPTVYVTTSDSGWHVERLKSLALTNNPALDTMSANFAAEGEADETDADEDEAEASGAAVEPIEAAAEGQGTTEPAPAPQTPAEAQAQAPADATTAALTATAPSADVVALTADRDTARTEVVALNAQLVALTSQVTALTAERDQVTRAFAEFKTQTETSEVERVIERFTASGQCSPAEHEDLREYASAMGAEKLTASLSKRVASAAFQRLSYGTAPETQSPEAQQQREWLLSQGFTPAF